MQLSDKIYEKEYQKINSIHDLLIYLYKMLLGEYTSGNQEFDWMFKNTDTRKKMIGRFLLESYENGYRINDSNYLNISNANFIIDNSNNWLYDKSVNVSSNSFCKVYFGIKKEKYFKIIKSIVKIIEIVKSYNNGLGQCKFRTFPSNNSVILRFKEKEAFITFMNIIQDDKDILNCLSKPNLFIPNIGGVGISTDSGGAYTFVVEILLTNYLFLCVDNKQEPTLDDFTRFILNTDFMKVLLIAKMCNYDEEIAYDYKENLVGKINGEDDKKLIKMMFR